MDDVHASRLPDYDQSDEARFVHLHQAGAREYDTHAEAITSRFRRGMLQQSISAFSILLRLGSRRNRALQSSPDESYDHAQAIGRRAVTACDHAAKEWRELLGCRRQQRARVNVVSQKNGNVLVQVAIFFETIVF